MFDLLHTLFELAFAAAFMAIVSWALQDCPKKDETLVQVRHERIPLLDVLKGVAIIAVVLLHTQSVIPYFALYSFAVPVFVLASGFLLMNRYGRTLDLKAYGMKIFLRIVLMYLLIVVGLRLAYGAPLTVQDVAWDMAFGQIPYLHDSPVNYFMGIIILLYALFPLMARWRRALYGAGALSLLLLFSMAAQDVADFFEPRLYVGSALYSINLIMPWPYLFFFVFGAGVWQYDFGAMDGPRRRTLVFSMSALMLAGTALFAYMGYQRNLFILPAALFVTALCAYRARGLLAGLVGGIGKKTLLIYLLHWGIYYWLQARLWGGKPSPGALDAIGLSLAVLTLACLLAIILEYGAKAVAHSGRNLAARLGMAAKT